MVQLILDNHSVEASSENILNVLDKYLQECAEKDRVLYSCTLDEDVVEDFDNLGPLIQERVQSLRRVSLVTVPRILLVSETIESAAKYIDSLQDFIEEAVSKMQTGSPSQITEWDLFFSGMEWIISVAAALLQQEEVVLRAGDKLKENITNLDPAIRGIGEAFKEQDFVTLGDVLEYELAPKLAEVKETLLGVLESLGDGKDE